MLKIGLIGAGRMGNAHAGNLAGLAQAQITGVYDIDPEKSKVFAEKYPTARIFGSARELTDSPDTDLVIIASPSPCHPEAVRLAIEAGKAVFCEKPLCRTKEQLDEIAPLIRNCKTFFAVGFVRRYAASAITMRKMVKEGKIGKISHSHSPISSTAPARRR